VRRGRLRQSPGVVFDADTGKYSGTGARTATSRTMSILGHTIRRRRPRSSSGTRHCADLSVDRLLYVCDRSTIGFRFQADGVRQGGFYNKETLGSDRPGTSPSPAIRRSFYLADGERQGT
jgi:hypothetical protein